VWANATLSDIATAVTNSLDRTGASAGMTGQFKASDGAVGAPGWSFGSEPTSGVYRAGSGDFRFSIAGTDTLKFAFANPTGSIGLAAVNGTSLNPTRSDATPALSQAIAPTWTGVHTFSNTVSTNGTLNINAGAVITGTLAGTPVAVSGAWAFSPATTTTFNGASGQNTITANGNASSGNSFGILVTAGTTSADTNALFRSTGGTAYFKIRGDGLVQAGDDANVLQTVGWRDCPQTALGAATTYTTVLSDRGKDIHSESSTTCAITIPPHSSVAYPVGTVLVITNRANNPITVVQGAGVTIFQAGTSVTGTRTLAVTGMCSLLQTNNDVWLISGSGLT
jgi:hypothetical protein